MKNFLNLLSELIDNLYYLLNAPIGDLIKSFKLKIRRFRYGPPVRVFCYDVKEISGAVEMLEDLVNEHKKFKKFDFSGMGNNNFYILEEIEDNIKYNYLGFTNCAHDYGRYEYCKVVSFEELLLILGGKLNVKKLKVNLNIKFTTKPHGA